MDFSLSCTLAPDRFFERHVCLPAQVHKCSVAEQRNLGKRYCSTLVRPCLDWWTGPWTESVDYGRRSWTGRCGLEKKRDRPRGIYIED